MYIPTKCSTTCDPCSQEPQVVNNYTLIDIPVIYIYQVDLTQLVFKIKIVQNINLTFNVEDSYYRAGQATGIMEAQSGEVLHCVMTPNLLLESNKLYINETPLTKANEVGEFIYNIDFIPEFTETQTKENTRFCVNLGYQVDWYRWDGYHFVKIGDERFFQPNVYYQWINPLNNLHVIDFELLPKDDLFFHQYMFDFTTGETSPKLIFSSDIIFGMLPEFEPNLKYQISVVNNLGLIARGCFQKQSDGSYKGLYS